MLRQLRIGIQDVKRIRYADLLICSVKKRPSEVAEVGRRQGPLICAYLSGLQVLRIRTLGIEFGHQMTFEASQRAALKNAVANARHHANLNSAVRRHTHPQSKSIKPARLGPSSKVCRVEVVVDMFATAGSSAVNFVRLCENKACEEEVR
jgi:hypothetical protein